MPILSKNEYNCRAINARDPYTIKVAINLGPSHCTLLRAMALYLHGSLRHACVAAWGKDLGNQAEERRSRQEGRPFFSYKFYGGWNECAHKKCSGNREKISLVWAELRLGRNRLIEPNSSLRGPKTAFVNQEEVLVGRLGPDDRRPIVPPRGSPVSSL